MKISKLRLAALMAVFASQIGIAIFGLLNKASTIYTSIVIAVAIVAMIVTMFAILKSDICEDLALKNRALLLIFMLTLLLFYMGVTLEYHYDGLRNFVYIVSIIPLLGAMIVSVGLYYKDRRNTKYKTILLVMFVMCFSGELFVLETPWQMYAPFALFTMYLMYNEVKIMSKVCGILGFTNVMCVYRFCKECGNLDNMKYMKIAYTIQIMFVILFVCSLCYLLVLNNRFNNEKIANMTKLGQQSREMTEQVKSMAMSVRKSVVETNDVITDLEKVADKSVIALEKITYDNKENVNNVEQQTQMTSNIADMIDDVSNETGKAQISTVKSLNGLHKSKVSVEGIKKKSSEIVASNKDVMESITEFVENIRKVKNITSGIAEISEQTNLLSLNASIESARAGEAGKGFMVVAGEISSLADGTAKLTEDINKIVHMLENNAIKAQKVVGTVAEEVKKENITIEDTLKDFLVMEEDIAGLGENIKSIWEKINVVAQYNEEIVNHTSQLWTLSSVMQDSTKEALMTNEVNKQKASKIKVFMNDLLEETEKINNLQEEELEFLNEE